MENQTIPTIMIDADTTATTLAPQYPIIYKRNKDGSVQYWKVWVQARSGPGPYRGIIGYDVMTEYGQVGTDSPQTAAVLVDKGKNLGKKNETSVCQQAWNEAESKWEKQVKKGYTPDRAKAEAGEDDVQGGVKPMLAERFMDVVYDRRPGHEGQYELKRSHTADKIKFPCYAQAKLDGIRCIAVIVDGKCTLWSRTRKPINSVPHIVEELEDVFKGRTITLDGELYNHKFKKEFEKIVSVVRRDKPDQSDPNTLEVQYHVYDIITDLPYPQEERTRLAAELGAILCQHVFVMQTVTIESEVDLKPLLEKFLEFGYEGVMLRNIAAPYDHFRTTNLQKVKAFDEEEFPIVGYKGGKGKMEGKIIFECRAKNGKEFDVKLEGDLDYLKTLYENHGLWQNKLLTVTYQGLTAKGVPRFPVGKAIRDYE